MFDVDAEEEGYGWEEVEALAGWAGMLNGMSTPSTLRPGVMLQAIETGRPVTVML